jgi:hypothetical protein
MTAPTTMRISPNERWPLRGADGRPFHERGSKLVLRPPHRNEVKHGRG